MRYGGHQTFFVREGWLSKGLKMLIEQPDLLNNPYLADYLGVGRNMAKSIVHWLQATGLAFKEGTGRRGPKSQLVPTTLARNIAASDPHFTHTATWWFLHINLICNPEHAATWNWFFNEFPVNRFDREMLIMSLWRYEKTRSKKVPTRTTLERDISCFLGSYGVDVPYKRSKDPEEEIDCPFQELRLIRHYRASGYYEVNRRKKVADPEVILYALNSGVSGDTGDRTDITFHELARVRNGPLQSLALSADALFEHMIELEQAPPPIRLSISGLAGDRQVRFPVLERSEIANLYYQRVREVVNA
jgi:hypothetical protein